MKSTCFLGFPLSKALASAWREIHHEQRGRRYRCQSHRCDHRVDPVYDDQNVNRWAPQLRAARILHLKGFKIMPRSRGK